MLCTDRRIPCDPGKVCNPATGRCVKKSSRIGRMIGLPKKKVDNCEDVKCPITKICTFQKIYFS